MGTIKNKLHLFPRLIAKTFYKRWNLVLLRFLGAEIGKQCQFYNHIHIKVAPKSVIKIGDDVIIKSGSGYNPLARNIQASICVERGAKLIIGSLTGISSSCIWASNSISIGNNVNIGADTIILDTDCHNINYLKRKDRATDAITSAKAPIVIKDDVLIGTRCIILKGVTIGARSVIGAGSVVTQSIPADSIAAGNPCKVIKSINNK